MKTAKEFTTSCPIPIQDYPQILLAHGGGGKLMHQLIDKMFKPAFSQQETLNGHDCAVIETGQQRLAFTTDSFVVQPLFFPGGDIGVLAVNGTVNDLSMAGARPLGLSVAYILEEGVSTETLWRVTRSVSQTAQEAGVQVLTGDTKVVDKGKGDGIYINTTGIGILEHDLHIDPQHIQEGDQILLNGDIAAHGMAIMAVREGLEFESRIQSDTVSLSRVVLTLLKEGIEIHCMRDCTRGGLSSTLNEIAQTSGLGLRIDETLVPLREDVAAACEFLGLDPLYVANEGRFVCFVPEKDASKALDIMRRQSPGEQAALVGEVIKDNEGTVLLKSRIGTERILDMISGEQLPRIC